MACLTAARPLRISVNVDTLNVLQFQKKKIDCWRKTHPTATMPLCTSVDVDTLNVLQFQRKKNDCWKKAHPTATMVVFMWMCIYSMSCNSKEYVCECWHNECVAIPEQISGCGNAECIAIEEHTYTHRETHTHTWTITLEYSYYLQLASFEKIAVPYTEICFVCVWRSTMAE